MKHAFIAVLATVLLTTSGALHAQLKRPRAEVTPAIETSPLHPGAAVHLALKVKLPADVHVQSDKPRDASLIPTVLAIDAPPGVIVEKISYPPATDLVQAGQSQPLAVLGPEFTIEIRLALAATVPAGPVTIPARLRYQACDRTVCYPPARAEAQWTLAVEAP